MRVMTSSLELEPLAIACACSSVASPCKPLVEARTASRAKLLVLVVADRRGRIGLRFGARDRAALRDDRRVGDRLGQVGEQLGHRRGRP